MSSQLMHEEHNIEPATAALPPTFIQYDFRIKIPSMRFAMENEFGQKLLAMQVDGFGVSYCQSTQFFKANMELLGLTVEDFWSNGIERLLVEQRSRPSGRRN
jgi:hypothetical protein